MRLVELYLLLLLQLLSFVLVSAHTASVQCICSSVHQFLIHSSSYLFFNWYCFLELLQVWLEKQTFWNCRGSSLQARWDAIPVAQLSVLKH